MKQVYHGYFKTAIPFFQTIEMNISNERVKKTTENHYFHFYAISNQVKLSNSLERINSED